MWDERYATPGHAYGESPNDFLAEQAALLPPGPVVDLAGGEYPFTPPFLLCALVH